MLDFTFKENYTFEDLLHIMEILRAPGGCMWDREQDHHSIRRNFIEETYEAIEAIDNDDAVLLQEELGDVLLQVVFHAQMEKEKGVFDIQDVADGICKKLIFRHPHIFGDTKVKSTEEILGNWEDLKKTEKHQQTAADGLESVARSLPALIRADKVLKKASKAGFDWENVSSALAKAHEELAEVECAFDGDGNLADEIGDLFFAAVHLARFAGVEPEQALERATDKFIQRFTIAEQQATVQNQAFSAMTQAELETLWQQAKHAGGQHDQK